MSRLVVKWTIPAYNDLMVFVNYYRHEAGLGLASKFADAIEKSLENLSLMPTIARPGFKINTRQYILQDFPFIIEFRIRNNSIEILAFLHQARKT